MKIYETTQRFSLVLFIAIVVGCTQISVSPTNSLPPKETTKSLLELIPTSTITLSPTPTTIPTLPVDDARKRVLELLANNGNCRLPCLWGITPGKSKDLESQSILLPLSSIAETTYFNQPKVNGILLGAITPLYDEGDFRLSIRMAYAYADNGIVSHITFRVQEEEMVTDSDGNLYGEPIFDSPTFAERIEYYSLSHVLTEQGVPDSVMISFYLPSKDPTFDGGFKIALLYPEQGIWINYAMPLYDYGVIESGCPASAHVEMNLYPSGDPEAFYLLLEKTDWPRMKEGYKPLEEATSMSLEEFYQTFRNPTDQCVETPANLWLTPEP